MGRFKFLGIKIPRHLIPRNKPILQHRPAALGLRYALGPLYTEPLSASIALGTNLVFRSRFFQAQFVIPPLVPPINATYHCLPRPLFSLSLDPHVPVRGSHAPPPSCVPLPMLLFFGVLLYFDLLLCFYCWLIWVIISLCLCHLILLQKLVQPKFVPPL